MLAIRILIAYITLIIAGCGSNPTPKTVATQISFAANDKNYERLYKEIDRYEQISTEHDIPVGSYLDLILGFGFYHNKEIIEYLVSKGGDPQPIWAHAAKKCDIERMDFAVSIGAKPKDYPGMTFRPRPEITLMHDKQFIMPDPRLFKPTIQICIEQDNGNGVKALLSRGVDPNGLYKNQFKEEFLDNLNFSEILEYSNLDWAVIHNKTNVVQDLLTFGANPNFVLNKQKKTTLHYAYDSNPRNERIIELLVTFGADQEAKDRFGLRPDQVQQRDKEHQKEHVQAIEAGKRLEARLEKIKQAKAQRARLQAQREKARTQFNWFKAAAMTAGFVAGNGLKLDAEAQMDAISGIMRDSMAGNQGVSNTTSALNNATQRYQTQNAQRAQQNQVYSQPANAKDHYADIRGRSDLKNCNSSSTQANSFCQTANAYYQQYLQTLKSGSGDAEDIYAIHKRTVRDMMNLVKNHQNKTTLVLDDAAGKSCDTVMSRLSNQMSCQLHGVASYTYCLQLDRTAPSHCTKQCSDRFQSMLASLDCSIKPSKGGQRGQAVRN